MFGIMNAEVLHIFCARFGDCLKRNKHCTYISVYVYIVNVHMMLFISLISFILIRPTL